MRNKWTDEGGDWDTEGGIWIIAAFSAIVTEALVIIAWLH